MLLLTSSFLSANAHAAYCVREMNNGNLRLDSTSVENCPSELVLLSKSDYDAINIDSIVATLIDLFEFSALDFAFFNAICLVGFITGHFIGRVARIFGKT